MNGGLRFSRSGKYLPPPRTSSRLTVEVTAAFYIARKAPCDSREDCTKATHKVVGKKEYKVLSQENAETVASSQRPMAGIRSAEAVGLKHLADILGMSADAILSSADSLRLDSLASLELGGRLEADGWPSAFDSVQKASTVADLLEELSHAQSSTVLSETAPTRLTVPPRMHGRKF